MAAPVSPEQSRLPGKNRRVLLAVFSGILLSLCYPLFNFWWLAWAALIPLYFAWGGDRVGGKSSFVRDLIPGFVFGVLLFLVGMFWMNEIGALPWFVLACIQAMAFALLGGICAVLLPRLPGWARPLVFAALWVLAEWARSQGALAFPWFMLSSSQARVPVLLQIVSLTGQWGLSFAIAAVNGYLAEAWRAGQNGGLRTATAPLSSAAAIIGGLIGFSVPLYQYYDRPTVSRKDRKMTVAIAQGSYTKPGSYDGDAASEALSRYLDLSRDAGAANPTPDLITWPETTVPYGLMNNPDAVEGITSIARSQEVSLLVGTSYSDSADSEYNSAMLIEPEGSIGARYDKVQLVPVGEFFPARWLLANIYARYNVPPRDMAAGTTEQSLSVRLRNGGTARLGPLICYESVFPTHSRAQVLDGAQAIVLLTSDQTFGLSAGPYQHADQSVIRAIETRRWLVRAASTGVSEFINPAGRVTASLGLMERGVLSREIALRDEKTLFVQWGNWFIALCGVIALLAAGMAIKTKRRVNNPFPASASAEESPSL